ncbi:MAG: AI-2E family transporter [Clostridia bacterium]
MNEIKTKLKTTLGANLIVATYTVVLFLALTNIVTIFKTFATYLSYLSPFFVAICIAFIFNLPMKFIESKLLSKFDMSKNIKRILSVLLTFTLFFAIVTGLIMFIYPQMEDSIITLSSSIQGYVINFEAMASDILIRYEIPQEVVTILDAQFAKVVDLMTQALTNFVPYTINLSIQLVSSAFNLILSFILALYMLIGKESLITNMKRLIYAIFSKKIGDEVIRISALTNKTFSSFIGGQLTEACILGCLVTIGMILLRLEYALLIGAIMGVMAVIPIFGAFVGAIPGVVILMMISPMKAVIFVVFIIILQQIEGNLIYPRVVGSSIGISGLWIMFALLLGGGLYGVVGILLGIPLFAVLYILVGEWTSARLQMKKIKIEDREVLDIKETIDEKNSK